MLEYWYKEKRTLVDFRRGPLGPHFDGFAAYLKSKGYSRRWGQGVLGKCCQFNAFLIERGICTCAGLSDALIDSFFEAFYAPVRATASKYSPQNEGRCSLKLLFSYLAQTKVFIPPKPKPVIKPYTWLLNPFLGYLRSEREVTRKTITYYERQLGLFLDCLGPRVARKRLKNVTVTTVETSVKQFLRNSTAEPGSLSSALRIFLRYCAKQRYTQMDFSGLVPPVRRYRHASLPKGMEDSALERMLKAVKRDTAFGARDYAILLMMMAYGVRAVSVAQILLEDLDWNHSRMRIRAQKGGKEVVVPLLDQVGEALVQYLRYRPANTPFREVFLGLKAPFRPLSGLAIARVVLEHMKKAGVKSPRSGVRTLRHSWAIRALAHNSTIKSIADVLGHRYIDTTFIYAKADVNSLKEVAMPWPAKR